MNVGVQSSPLQRDSSDSLAPAEIEQRVSSGGSIVERQASRVFLAAALLVMCGLAAYSNSLTGGFIFDDQSNIVDNHMIRSLWPLWGPFAEQDVRGGWHFHTRPVVALSFALNYVCAGLATWPYHATNLVIHILAGLTLFGLIRRTLLLPSMSRFSGAATQLAAAIAIAWTVHPLNTQAVTYVVQRYESLMGLFYLLTMYGAVRAMTADRPRRWIWAASGTCVLALASKEVAVSLPIVTLLYDRAFVAGSFAEAWRRRRGLHLALFGLLLAFVPFYKMYSGGEGQWAGHSLRVPWYRYAWSESGVVLHYLRLAFWPTGQCLDYGWPAASSISEVGGPLLAIVTLLVVTLWLTVRKPGWGFLGASFFLILAPTSSVMPIVDLAYEHRMYLSLAAVIAAAAIAVHWAIEQVASRRLSLPRRQAIFIATFSTAIVSLGVTTHLRNRVYADQITAWTDTIHKAPLNSRAHSNLGVSLLYLRQLAPAADELRTAIRLAPENVDAYANLGACLLQQHDLAGARTALERAVALNPYSELAQRNLATVLLEQGEIPAADLHFRAALALAPNDSKLHFNYACLQIRSGDRRRAEEHLQETVRLAPHDVAAHFALANVLADQQRWPEAFEHWRAALALDPDHVGAHVNLARALIAAGREPEAAHHLQAALRLDPANGQALGLANSRAAREASGSP
jgi:tetratricopeptide (TPR) repeat protein